MSEVNQVKVNETTFPAFSDAHQAVMLLLHIAHSNMSECVKMRVELFERLDML